MTSAAAKIETAPEDELAAACAEILAGRGAGVVARLEALAQRLHPAPVAYYWLSAAHGAAGNVEAQAEALQTAQTFHALEFAREVGVDLAQIPHDPDYARDVAGQLYNVDLMSPVSLCLSSHVGKAGTPIQDLLMFALSLQHQGRMDEAMAAFAVAVELCPDPGVHQFMLYAAIFAKQGVSQHAEQVRKWSELYFPDADWDEPVLTRRPLAGRRLRIGYVAPDFTASLLRQCFLPVLEAHDPAEVEVFLYPANAEWAPTGDPVVRAIGGMDDAEAQALILADEIDVLVDLWGHAANGRPGLFKRRAAPVQTSWINYVQSTGLETMDYVIHAEGMDAPGTEALFTEAIWRLPIIAPFRPDPRPPLAAAPALKNGHVTFGCFDHPAKLSDPAVAAWARILKASPRSKLLLKHRYFVDPVLKASLGVRFAAHGVGPDRVEMRGASAGPEHQAAFADVDLMLDTWPCPGGAAGCEAAANGAPVLTLRGADFYARTGLAATEAIGVPELVAETVDDYVAKAVALAADPEGLSLLRAHVVEKFEASLLRDEAGFTRIIEQAFREMFERWQAAAAG